MEMVGYFKIQDMSRAKEVIKWSALAALLPMEVLQQTTTTRNNHRNGPNPSTSTEFEKRSLSLAH